MTASRVVLYLGLITNIYNNLEIVFRTRFIGFYNLIPLIFQKDSGDGVNSRQPRTTRSEKRYLTFERLFLHLNLPNIRLVDNEFPYQQPSCKCQAMPISECLVLESTMSMVRQPPNSISRPSFPRAQWWNCSNQDRRTIPRPKWWPIRPRPLPVGERFYQIYQHIHAFPFLSG